jgi:hypothetical protein
MGFGDKWFAVPWDAMQFSPHDKKFILNVNKELLEQAPGFDKDHWPSPDSRQFALEVYKYYGECLTGSRSEPLPDGWPGASSS